VPIRKTNLDARNSERRSDRCHTTSPDLTLVFLTAMLVLT
jgi:hypothetical protein